MTFFFVTLEIHSHVHCIEEYIILYTVLWYMGKGSGLAQTHKGTNHTASMGGLLF